MHNLLLQVQSPHTGEPVVTPQTKPGAIKTGKGRINGSHLTNDVPPTVLADGIRGFRQATRYI